MVRGFPISLLSGWAHVNSDVLLGLSTSVRRGISHGGCLLYTARFGEPGRRPSTRVV